MHRILLIILACCYFSIAATETITGTVTDSISGDPLKAVLVTAKAGTESVYTDASGNFSINTETAIRGFESIPVIMAMAEPVRVLDANGVEVSPANMPDGIYLQEVVYKGDTYLVSLVRSNGTDITGTMGIRSDASRGKTAGNADLTFGKCAYRFKEKTLVGGGSSKSIVMSPLPADAFPAVPEETGILDPTILQPSGTITVTQNDQVIENVDINGYIHIKDAVDNITIRNFRITTTTYWGIYIRNAATTNVVIENGEIRGNDVGGDAISTHDYTARWVYIHNMGGDAFKCFGDCVIEKGFFTSIGQAPGAHGDGVQGPWNDGTYGNAAIRYNNFLLNSGSLTACIFTGSYLPRTDVEKNRLSGGSYTVYCNSNIHVVNNVFGRDDAYGAHTGTCGTWTGNTWFDTGETVP